MSYINIIDSLIFTNQTLTILYRPLEVPFQKAEIEIVISKFPEPDPVHTGVGKWRYLDDFYI
ncbi:hypothetical protein HpBTM60_05880 [Helicobacter pylori]